MKKLACLIFLSIVSCKSKAPPNLDTVKAADVTKTVQLIGRAYSLSRNVISAPFDSKVSKLNVRLGERVEKGQPLIALSSEDISERIKTQRLAISKNKSQLATYSLQIRKLKKDLSRDREAARLRVVASSQADETAYQLKVAESEAESLSSVNTMEMEKLKDMEGILAQGNLRSLIAGTVIDMWVNHTDFYEGIPVRAGEALVTIASAGPMKVKALAPEFLTAALIDKQSVRVQLNSDSSRSWIGTVVSIKPPAVKDEDSVGNFEVIVDFYPPENTIRNGLEALVVATVGSRKQVAALPKSAIQTIGNSNFVIKRKPAGSASRAKYQKVEVKLGLVGDELVEIQGGLNIGDQVLHIYEELN